MKEKNSKRKKEKKNTDEGNISKDSSNHSSNMDLNVQETAQHNEKDSSNIRNNDSSEIKTDCVHKTTKDDFDFFKMVIDTIPPSAFFSDSVKEQLSRDSDESEESDDEEEKSVKKRTKKEEKLQQPTKKQKPNPLHNKTVSQIQSEISSTEGAESYSKIKEKQKHKKNSKAKKLVSEKELANTANRMQLLRERLNARIEELKGKRGKLSVDEALEKKRLKRKESKLKLKMRRKSEKQNKNKVKSSDLPVENGGDISSNKKAWTPHKPAVVDKGGKLVFSKFDFTDKGEKPKNKLAGKDYHRLLEKIEKRKEKINSVKEKDAEKGKQLMEKEVWQKAMLKAEGQKVKDDPMLLKKAMKKKEKVKEKRQQKWKERTTQVQKRKDVKQEKREKNIQERKDAKVQKKIKRSKKTGHIIPGF